MGLLYLYLSSSYLCASTRFWVHSSSSSSISFITLCGFWLSQPGRFKLLFQRYFFPVTFITFIPSHPSSSLLLLGLLVRQVSIGFHSNILFTVLQEPIICI
jgi:hypothetical protein